MSIDEKKIEAKLGALTRKLQRLAEDWKSMSASDYNRQHDKLTNTIDELLDEAQKKKL